MTRRISTTIIIGTLLAGVVSLAPPWAHAQGTQTLGDPQWIQLSPTGTPPSPRGGMSAVFDPPTDQMIIFGGINLCCAPFDDVWALQLGATPEWAELSPAGTAPTPRQLAAAVYDASSSSMIMFGGGEGNTSPCQNDVWVLSNANGLSGVPSWTQLATAGGPPSPRYAHAVYDPTSNTMIIFGGNNCFSTYYNDVWTLSSANGLGGTPTWTQLSPSGTAPAPRSFASAVYDPASNTVVVFGGWSGTASLNDVWTLSNANGLTGTPTWTELLPAGPLPPGRIAHTAVYDPTTDVMTIFGGVDPQGTLLNDVWTLSNANGHGGTPAWTQLAPSGTPPAPRASHSAVLDSITGSMVIFGGYVWDPATGTYHHDNDSWVLIPSLVNLSPSTLSFGNQLLGSTSATQTVTLTNMGNSTLNIASINLSGSFFALVTTPTSCPYTGETVAAQATCTIDVTFTPVGQAGLGAQTGSISIADDAAGSPQSISLSGTGTAAATTTSISALAITYGSAASVTVSVTSVAGTVTGNVSLTVDSGSPLTQGLSSGSTVFTISGLGGGTHSLSASYPAQGIFAASSATGTLQVNQANSTTTLVSSASSSLYGQLISFSATVIDSSPGSSGTPTGTVTLTDTTTSTVLGAATLSVVNGLDIAAFSAYSLPAGINSLTAVYSGDTNFLTSSSATTQAVSIMVTAAPIVSLDPMAITFLGQDVITTSAPMTVALMNQGDATLAISGIRITGTNSSDFQIVSNTCGRSLAVSSSCAVNVTFSPQDTGARTASLSFTDNDGGSSTPVTQLISLTGSGLSAISTNFTKPSIAGGNFVWFASVFSAKGPIDSNGHEIDMSAYTIRVFVTGGAISFTANNNVYTLPVPDAVITFDPTVTSATTAFDAANNRWMTIVPSASPPILSPLQPPNPRTQMFDVNGHIFATGLAYQVPSGSLPGGIKNVTWSGAFSTDTPGVTIRWEWGAAVYSTFSATYANASSNVLGVKPVDNGMAPCAFQNADPAGTPENFKQYLVLGATADDPGDYVGDLTPPIGVVPSLVIATVSPLPVVFATPQAQQTTSSPMTVTLTNVHQSLGLNVASVTVNGDFGVAAASSPCSTSSAFVLPAASSCTLNVTFTPTDLGTRTGTLTFNFSAPTGLDPGIVPSALKVDLAGMTVGTETAPLVGLSQTSIAFGPQEINTQSAPQFITLMNTGDDKLVLASLLASGDFAIVNNNCPTTIAVSASCAFGVVFKPTAIGLRTGAVTITDNAVGSPQVVSLSGFGSP